MKKFLMLCVLFICGIVMSGCSTNSKSLIMVELDEAFALEESDVLVSIGIAKDREDLKSELNAALADLSDEKRDEMMLGAVERQSEINPEFSKMEDYTYDETKDTLVIGLECNYAPFNWAQPTETKYSLPIDGQKMFADGYDVQVAKYLANELDVNVVLKMIEWNSLIVELNSEKIDLIIAGMSPTEERKKTIDFTDGYYRTTHVVVMRADSPYANATKLSDFDGARGVGQKDTLYFDLLAQLPGLKSQEARDSVPLIGLDLLDDKNSVSILEKPVAQALVAANS